MKTITNKIKRAAAKACVGIGLAVGLTLGAQAQNIQYILNSGVVPIGASNVTTLVSHVGPEVSIQTTFALTGAGTAGLFFILEASNDNSRWATTPHNFWRAANGATAVNHITNFNVGAYPFLRLTVHNTNSVAATNSYITVNNKRAF